MRIQVIRGAVVNRIELMYQPELSTLKEPERRQTVLAIEALIDIESWARLSEFFASLFNVLPTLLLHYGRFEPKDEDSRAAKSR